MLIQRYFLEISYKGTNYCGWQRQKNAVSVQQTLEEKLNLILPLSENVVGCGRTDSGVHAKQFFLHFDTNLEIRRNFIQKLNSLLPGDIAAKKLYSVPENGHARFSAISRTYHYYITTVKDPFLMEFSKLYTVPLDLEKMNSACEIIKGATDFQTFCRKRTDVKNFNCFIEKAVWRKDGDLFVFEITANRFLRTMVRMLVGAMIDIGRGKLSIEKFRNNLAARNIQYAGHAASAQGLFLTGIKYPDGFMQSFDDKSR
jgi:tRNA pseudouridine38-40 synthase